MGALFAPQILGQTGLASSSCAQRMKQCQVHPHCAVVEENWNYIHRYQVIHNLVYVGFTEHLYHTEVDNCMIKRKAVEKSVQLPKTVQARFFTFACGRILR